MALPPPVVGDIVLLAVESTIFGQKLLLTHTYRFTTAASSTPIDQVLGAFLQAVNQNGDNDIMTNYAECLPTNQTITQITAQKIYPTRYAKVSALVNLTGGVASPATVCNTAGTLTFVDGIAGRSHVATKHIGALPTNASVNGLISGGQKDSLNDLGNVMITAVTAGTGFVLTPVIYHRSADGPQNKTTLITGFRPGDTARVMRRRTVGLGI